MQTHSRQTRQTIENRTIPNYRPTTDTQSTTAQRSPLLAGNPAGRRRRRHHCRTKWAAPGLAISSDRSLPCCRSPFPAHICLPHTGFWIVPRRFRQRALHPARWAFLSSNHCNFFHFFFCFVFLVSSLPRVVGVHALEPGHLSFSTNVKLPAYPTYLLRIDPATPEPKQNDSDIIAAGLPFLSIQPAVQLPSGCRVFFYCACCRCHYRCQPVESRPQHTVTINPQVSSRTAHHGHPLDSPVPQDKQHREA